MRCPHCNEKNPDNAIFCRRCDAWILGPVYIGQAHPPRQRRKKRFWAPRKKWMIPMIVSGAVLAAVIAIVLFLPSLAPQPGPSSPIASGNHVQYVHSIMPYDYENKLCFVSNDTFLETGFTSYQSFSTSLDGRTAAVLTSNQTLLYIRDNTIQEIGQNVTDFILSASGDGVAFLDTSHALSLYHIGTKQSVSIAAPVEDFVISPDGKTVAYMQNAILSSSMDARTLFIYRDGESTQRVLYRDLTSLISVSNDAEYVYTNTYGSILCNYPDGTTTTIGFARAISLNSEMYVTLCNADHSQLLFYGGDGTYLSVQGQEAVKISSAQVYPVSPAQTNFAYHGSRITHSSHDLTAQIYYDYATGGILSSVFPSYNLWKLNADNTCQELVSACDSYWMDPTGQYIYYRSSAGELRLLDLQGGKERPILASNVMHFVVTYDCSTVYYFESNRLYSLSLEGDSQPQLIHTGFGAFSLQITQDNQLYVLGNLELNYYTLYTYKNGKLELVMEQVFSYTHTDNGMLYITTNDAYWLCGADGTLQKLRVIDPLVPKPYSAP